MYLRKQMNFNQTFNFCDMISSTHNLATIDWASLNLVDLIYSLVVQCLYIKDIFDENTQFELKMQNQQQQ